MREAELADAEVVQAKVDRIKCGRDYKNVSRSSCRNSFDSSYNGDFYICLLSGAIKKALGWLQHTFCLVLLLCLIPLKNVDHQYLPSLHTALETLCVSSEEDTHH